MLGLVWSIGRSVTELKLSYLEVKCVGNIVSLTDLAWNACVS